MASVDVKQFATDVLKGLGFPVTTDNLQAFEAWAQAEGGHAAFNPLNTTQHASGASNYNSVGVKNYTSYNQGVQATIQTLQNGHYGQILNAFKAGNNAMAVAQGVAASPWGTGTGVIRVLGGKVSDLGINGASSVVDPVAAGANNPTAAGVTKLTPDEFNKEIQSLGYSTAFINSDPSLRGVFQQALQNGWDPSGVEFTSALQNSTWWKARSADQRAFDQLRLEDPAQFTSQLNQHLADVKNQAAQLGVTLDPNTLDTITRTLWRNGSLSNAGLVNAALTAQYHYKAGQATGGTIGTTMDAINQAASNYFVKVDPNTVAGWATKVASGTATVEQYTQFLKNQAESKFPWLKQQLDGGMTVSDIASPYKQEMSSLLEIDPNSIKNDDPNLLKGLQYIDPQNTKAGYNTMPLWQYQQTLKNDPRWLATNNAQSSIMDAGIGVLKDFGLTV